MSLDKAIQHKKEFRREYRGAASWDSHCRNHGRCSWCEGNRLYSSARELLRTRDELLRWEEESHAWSQEESEVFPD